ITPLNRHAFLQFSRIPAATDDLFAPDAAYSVSVPRHGDMVIGDLAHIDFYVNGLGLETRGAPSYNDWTDTATRDALDMREGETFSVVGLRAPGAASGLLRVYVVHTPTDDARAVSRPGHLGLCCFSYRFSPGELAAVRERVAAHGATEVSAVVPNEFGEPALTFTAPDGIAWTVQEAA
ncbi:MAG: hypothetical protein NZ518_01920, partial [Dehalococcoidia bacterium]|nr:hypothetical protein [Dehalococcoidia bacterium]